jgi:hypothetical protein
LGKISQQGLFQQLHGPGKISQQAL